MFKNSRRLWNVRAIPIRAIVCGYSPATDFPAKTTSPSLGSYTPVITLKTVVLPAPFGPIRLTISPSPTCRFSSESARRPPKDSERSVRFKTEPRPAPPHSDPCSRDDLHAPLPQQPLRAGGHHHNQDRADHELPGNGRLDAQPGLPDERRQV